jgi:pantoate--beta-alanine ligase
MKILKTNEDLASFKQSAGSKLVLVPTMGALHEGHLKLVEEGMKVADICLPYIFLNPTQFAEGEDFDQYPKTLDADLEKLSAMGVEVVWCPSVNDIYPNGTKATMTAGPISKVLEGEYRPHFFDGVVTVLYRMFDLSKPDFVMMGEKDFQQLQVTRAMVTEHALPVQIIGVPTMRDKNGLALSSRNRYLNEVEYKIAIELNKIIREMAKGLIDETQAHEKLLNAGFDKIDYCTARNSETFLSENPDRVLTAVHIGKTRLIDNMPIIP